MMIPKNKWTEEEIEILKNNYSKVSAVELSAILNKTYGAVLNKAKRLKIPSNKPFKHQKWFYNEEFFDIPNNINCYIAGFIAADGYVSEQRNKIVIHLASKDKVFLQTISDELKYTGQIKEYTNKEKDGRTRDTIWLILSNATKIINSLKHIFNINLCDKKNNILKAPNLTNKEHILSFIAGYIDGDGCISVSKQNRLELSLVGSQNLCEWIRSQFIDMFGNSFETIHIYKHSQCNLLIYKITGKKAQIIVNNIISLQDTNKFLLKRKWNKINETQYNKCL